MVIESTLCTPGNGICGDSRKYVIGDAPYSET
jgi:hypothetical protein